MEDTTKAADATQSDNFSNQEGSSTPLVLKIKNNNFFVDLSPDNVTTSLKHLIFYLLNSPIKKALSARANVPISILSMAYSTSIYDSENDAVKFLMPGSTTHKVLTRSRFFKLFGLPSRKFEDEVETKEVKNLCLMAHEDEDDICFQARSKKNH